MYSLTIGYDTAVIAVATFSALGFTVSFGVPTLVGAGEMVRIQKQPDIVNGPVYLPSFPQRLVLVLAEDWTRFFTILSIFFFASGILDVTYVAGSLPQIGADLSGVLFAAVALIWGALLAAAFGAIAVLVCAATYSRDEVQTIAETAVSRATAEAYVESGKASPPKKAAVDAKSKKKPGMSK